MSGAHLLLIHPDAEVASELIEGFGQAQSAPTLAADMGEALPLVREGPRIDLCLVEGSLAEAGDVARLREADRDLEIVAIVPSARPEGGPAALRAGCSDYLLWPSPPDDLRALIGRSLERGRLRREHRRLLAENIAVLHTQSLYRRCLDLLSTVDLEPLQELTVKVFCEMCDAQSGALWVRNERGAMVLRSHRGLWEAGALEPQIDPREGPLAARVEGGLPFAREGAGGQSFYTPLCANGEPVGLLLLADKLGGAFTAEDFGRARAVGDLAAVALRNARRFADLERGGLRDRDSPAYNLSYFIDYAGKELYKAHRYGRQFSLATIRLDNLGQLRRRVDSAAVGEAVRALVAQLAALIRDADILSKVSEDELYALLPETDRFGAMMFERRVRDAARRIEEAAPEGRPPLLVTVGGATFPADGSDFDELLNRCRLRMEEARQTLRRRLQLDELGFWETFEVLVDPRSARRVRARESEGLASHQGPLPGGLFAELQREICREILREPRARGLVYVGTAEIDPALPLFEALPAADVAARVYVLGRRGPQSVHHPVITQVFLDGAPVASGQAAHRHDFVLWLGEGAAYAYLHRRGEGEATFHTDDRLLVDHLVGRLQQAYDLQPY
ncbi:MAG: sensor domain-containing diguanylate cyclase [Myxococcales bacterium]